CCSLKELIHVQHRHLVVKPQHSINSQSCCYSMSVQEGGGSGMHEDREEGAPPSETTLWGEHESQTKAQRMDNSLLSPSKTGGGGSAMNRCEDREEGAPPSKTTLWGQHESQTKAQ
ncbi:hypothetical protein INR49_004852, partial [Caranx melampygus]